MKSLFKTFISLVVLIASTSSKAQLVQTPSDAKKLEINKKEFIGLPIENLLKQIKPPIKRVMALAGGTTIASHIFLYFVTDSEYNQYVQRTGKSPIIIDIQVAEGNFDMKNSEDKIHRFDWTKEDEEKYGKLTIVNIRVSGLN